MDYRCPTWLKRKHLGIPLLCGDLVCSNVGSMQTPMEFDRFNKHTHLSRIALGIAYDPLTGLRSHSGLLEEMDRDACLASVLDTHTSIVVSVRLPAMGADKVLALVGMRIHRSVRTRDTTAHLGNGEFVVIVADDAGMPIRTATRLKLALSLPYVIDGHEVVVQHRIGFVRLLREHLLVRPEAFLETAMFL